MTRDSLMLDEPKAAISSAVVQECTETTLVAPFVGGGQFVGTIGDLRHSYLDYDREPWAAHAFSVVAAVDNRFERALSEG